MFGTLQENLRPVHETALKPWGIATPACALVRNDTSFSVRFTERQTPIYRFAGENGGGRYLQKGKFPLDILEKLVIIQLFRA